MLHLTASGSMWYPEWANSDNLEFASLLLEFGADANSRNDEEKTPLHYVCMWESQNADLVELLLEHGADIDFDTAVRLGDWGKVRTFLRRADLTQSRDPRERLNYAIYADSPETVELLLKAGADPNQRPKYCPESSLYTASRLGNADIVRILLEHGADPNPKRYKPMAAAKNGSRRKTEIIDLLENALRASSTKDR